MSTARPANLRMDARIERRRIDWQLERWQMERRAIGAAGVSASESSTRRRIDPERIVRAAVRESLHTTLFDGVAAAIRTMLIPVAGGVTWYGQQEAHRIAYYDTLGRYGLARFDSEDRELLDVQTALADPTGWWWAFDSLCIMAERPSAVHTERMPGSAIVPGWVVLDPTPERIAQERNVETRRCAIERIGWDTYIEIAGLTWSTKLTIPAMPVACYSSTTSSEGWGRSGRILLAVNGSLERDGHRRR